MLAGREEVDQPLAGKSTLNRLELGDGQEDRYKRITFWKQGADELVSLFIETQPEEIILDVDMTDLPLHGQQEGRFFHGDYESSLLPAAVHPSAASTFSAGGRSSPTATRMREAWWRFNGWSG